MTITTYAKSFIQKKKKKKKKCSDTRQNYRNKLYFDSSAVFSLRTFNNRNENLDCSIGYKKENMYGTQEQCYQDNILNESCGDEMSQLGDC